MGCARLFGGAGPNDFLTETKSRLQKLMRFFSTEMVLFPLVSVYKIANHFYQPRSGMARERVKRRRG